MSAEPRTPSAAADAGRGRAAALRIALLTALAYGVAGELALLLAIPPGYASPLFPPAGLALAAVLVYGRAALPGVALGSLAVNVLLDAPLSAAAALALPWVTATGATLQAAVSASLVRRHLRQPLTLGEPRDVALFCLVGAMLPCLISPTVSTAALTLVGLLPAGTRAYTWWTWWGGDTLGVLIATPIALTVIGRPRADWIDRRVTLALPLLGAMLLLTGATVLVERWDDQRARSVFERDAAVATTALQGELTHALHALEAVRGLFIGSDDVTIDEFHRTAQPWLTAPTPLQALGYSERVARADIARFEARVALADRHPYRVFDRRDPGNIVDPAAGDADMVVIRYIEPLPGNSPALGVNALSIAAAREAIERSAATDAPAASAGFRLTQEPGDQTGIVIYRALYRRDPASASPAARRGALAGVVFATLRMQQSLDTAMRSAPRYLSLCLTDTDPNASRHLLAGSAGCDAPRAAGMRLSTRQTIAAGGRQWLLSVGAPAAAVPDAGNGNAWLFSSVGLVSAAVLTALLLTVTGRTRRIEVAVADRTADLRREVAERRRTESALRESEQRFRNIFEHAPVGIVYADLEGRVREANPRLREMLGDEDVALPQRSIGEIALADDRAGLADALAPLLRGEVSEVCRRARLRHRRGPVLWVQMIWSVLRDADDRPQRLVAAVEDITERLKREEAEQGRQLAESANRAKNEFLSRMSHELRTPLNAVLGFAQLLDLDRQPRLAEHQAVWTAQILKAGWHLLEMINDTLDLSRIEAGVLRLEPGPVELPPLVQHCMAMVAADAHRRGIRLSVGFADDALHAWGDTTRLTQVMTNLLTNAVKYNIDGGSVDVQARRGDSRSIEIRVCDTGLGLSEQQLADLFRPFNRLGRERSNTAGTGIGLVISRRLAELMGGSLNAESAPGQGATFVLSLPAIDGAPPSLPDTAAAAPPGDSYRHRRVHYIEDNETNVEVMRGILSHRPQVRLTVSTLGMDGLAAVRADRPDLILLDGHLPDIDGIELLRHFKCDAALADIPVLLVSADATPERIDAALAAGARQYLTKPLNFDGFLSLVDELLGEVDSGFA